MKPTAAVITLFFLLAATYWAFEGAIPRYQQDADLPAESFSTDRALSHVEAISANPHGVGFPSHAGVREYIVSALEEMGLETQLQSGYTGGDWANLSKAVNIIARIPGTRSGKALLLLSHYDSSPHSSLGASDAGSGVAVILESVRAFLAGNHTPANDIIILITDAEELGLNGADLFVNRHPWARDVGLALNFEARGSGGPGIMLIETNGGNAGLIEAFRAANPEYPVANSLAYSIYKMLPNDTDLTIFREDGDIDGFNFAFIDDHFDYHTALDTYERLDRRTLAHQGSYLVPLLQHFSQAPLDQLKSTEDLVYFNLPFFGLVTYPFSWIWPMILIAAFGFLFIVGSGLRRGKLSWSGIFRGFLPLLICLLLSGLTGYFAWPVLKGLYPAYGDILHGFTYNGYYYIAAWASLTIGICFLVYSRFDNLRAAEALVAPCIVWLAICAGLSTYLPGGAFFLIPGYALLMSLLISLEQEKANPYVLCLLGIPALWILAPLVRLFPVGLGLRMLVGASLLSCFIFLLLLAVFYRYPFKGKLGWTGLLLFVGFMAGAHFTSGFNEERPKPTSLLYVRLSDPPRAFWATHEKVLSPWTRAYLGPEPDSADSLNLTTLSSKYMTAFSYIRQAPYKDIPEPDIRVVVDTTYGGNRHLSVEIVPQRDVNSLSVFTTGADLVSASVNDIPLPEDYLKQRRGGRLVRHQISDNDPTHLFLEFPAGEPLELTLWEASNDLLENEQFSIPSRPPGAIPMPFVTNDAVLLIKSLRFE